MDQAKRRSGKQLIWMSSLYSAGGARDYLLLDFKRFQNFRWDTKIPVAIRYDRHLASHVVITWDAPY
jgi:hypothetical protein